MKKGETDYSTVILLIIIFILLIILLIKEYLMK